MKSFLVLALVLAFSPAIAFAQAAPPPGPDVAEGPIPNTAQRAAMQQMHAQAEQLRVQTRSRILTALTPAHRATVANIVGQLTLSADPNPRAAAQALDATLSPAEKQSVVAIDGAARSNMQALFTQQRAAFESTLTADQRARMQQHAAKMEAFRQGHPLPADARDPGAIVLRTLANIGGPHGPGHRM